MTIETTNRASLYRKIAAVAGAIDAVEKDARNKDQNYRYASPASVMAAVKPLMQAQSLAIVPHLVEFHEIDTGQKAGSGKPFIINRVTMHYHILDGESGEELVVPWQGQAGTYGDDKGLAKAQTIALRTFLIQLFQIPAEDPDADPDARDARPMQHQPQRQQARPAAGQPQRGGNAELVRGYQEANGASYEPPANAKELTRRERLIARIAQLTAEAEAADLEIELAKPVGKMSDDELIQHGKNLSAALAQHAAQDLFPQTTEEQQLKAA